MTGIVLDASVALCWCFEDQSTPATDAVLDALRDSTAVVPSLWFLEVVNAVAIGERRRQITADKVERFLARFETLAIETDDQAPSKAFHEILALCREHGLTAYDAAYLELAVRTSLPLATTDAQLRRAAAAIGVPLLPP